MPKHKLIQKVLSHLSNRANIKAEIKIGLIYIRAREYKERGRESLEQTLMAASQDETTKDLAEKILDILDTELPQ